MKKLYPLAQLARVIEAHKKKGRRIVLANGCFDIIHAGHIRYLKEAKKLGGILVLALNSDKSVRRLKGRGRPIQGEKDRAEIFSSFYFVDYITFFDEPTVARVLLALKPDLQAKGADYTEETVPEKEIVGSYGGKVAITGGPKIRWTSEVIKDVIQRNQGRRQS